MSMGWITVVADMPARPLRGWRWLDGEEEGDVGDEMDMETEMEMQRKCEWNQDEVRREECLGGLLDLTRLTH